MNFLRTLSPHRLAAIVAVVAALAATAAVAQAGLGSDPKPEPKALDRAILDAVNAPPVKGISARIEFTNSLIPSGSMPRRQPARRRRRRAPVDGGRRPVPARAAVRAR